MDRAQIAAFYQENGYVILPGLIGDEELERLKADTLKIARGGYPHRVLDPVPDEVSDRDALERILCLHHPHAISPVMLEFMKHPTVVDVLTAVIGPNVKCMQSMLFVKTPGSPGQAWHQDEAYIPTRDRSLCGAWIAIDDANAGNGCLYVVPGSHKSGYLYPQKDHGQPDEFDFAPESYGFDESEEVPVEVPAGTLVAFHGYLLHRSRKNRSSGYRRSLVCHYMNSYSLLPASTGDLDHRAVIPIAGEDPYAWKGYKTMENQVHLRWRTREEFEAFKERIEAGATAK